MTELFIEKSKLIHGDRYDYSNVDYKYNYENIIIICKIHGEFSQRPNNHLTGAGCGKCAGTAKITESEFLDKCNEKFGDLYDYSKMNYKNFNSIITICCKIHGNISIIPKSHLKGIGCPKCGNILNANKRKTPLDKFIKNCQEKDATTCSTETYVRQASLRHVYFRKANNNMLKSTSG